MKLADRLPSVEGMLRHPRHLAAQQSLAELISALRACINVKDGYEFQQELLTRVLELENDRHAFRRAARRVRNGKAPQPGAPEPYSGLDPADPETWQATVPASQDLYRSTECHLRAAQFRLRRHCGQP